MNPSHRTNPVSAAAPPPPPAPAGPALGSKLTPVDPLRVVRQHVWWILGAVVVGGLLGYVLHLGLAKVAPRYEAVGYIECLAAPGDPEDVTATSRQTMDEFERFRNTKAYMLRQSAVLQNVLKHNEVKQTAWYLAHADLPPGAIEKELLDIISITTPRNNAMIEIRARTRSRTDPSIIVNNIVREYISQVRSQKRLENTEFEVLMTNRRNKLRNDIDLLEDQMGTLAKETEISELQGNYHKHEAAYQKLIEARTEIESNLTASRSMYESLIQARDSGSVEYSAQEELQISQDPMLRNIDGNIHVLEQELQVALDRYGDQHMAVKNIKNRIAAAESQKQIVRQDLLRKLQDAQISGAQSAVGQLEDQFNKATEELANLEVLRKDLNERLRQYKSLRTDIDEKRAELVETEGNLVKLRMLAEREDANRVIPRGTARVPDTYVFPNMKVIIVLSILGCVGSVVAVVFLKEMLDSRIKSPADAKLLPPSTLLGVIPDAEEDPSGMGQIEMAVNHSSSGLMAETFRQIRSEVLRKVDQRHYKTLMITGCQPGSGVSSVASNLACSIAANGRRVLLIDVNFRRPVLHQLLEVENTAGIGDLLAGSATLEQTVQATSVDNLDVMTIGNASEHILERLESDAFSQALRRLEEAYDLIIIDAPPLSIVSDGKLLANRVQAVLLVARAMQEKRGLVSRLIHQLGSSKAELIGLVINGVRSATGGYYRRNFEAFYAYQNGSASDAVPSNGGRMRNRSRQTSDT